MRLLLISTVAVLLAAVAAQSETFKGKFQIGKKSCQCTLKCKNSEKNCCTVGCDKKCTSTGQLSVPPYSFTVQCKKGKCRIKGLCSIDSVTTAGPPANVTYPNPLPSMAMQSVISPYSDKYSFSRSVVISCGNPPRKIFLLSTGWPPPCDFV